MVRVALPQLIQGSKLTALGHSDSLRFSAQLYVWGGKGGFRPEAAISTPSRFKQG